MFFGEPDDLEWENLFQMFLKFFETYDKAVNQLEKLKKKREKEARAKEREERKKKRLAKKGMKAPTKAEEDKKTGGATNILEEIRFKSAAGTLIGTKKPSVGATSSIASVTSDEETESEASGLLQGTSARK